MHVPGDAWTTPAGAPSTGGALRAMWDPRRRPRRAEAARPGLAAGSAGGGRLALVEALRREAADDHADDRRHDPDELRRHQELRRVVDAEQPHGLAEDDRQQRALDGGPLPEDA